MARGAARVLIGVAAAAALLVAPGDAPAASGGAVKAGAGRHDAGRTACVQGRAGRACRKRRRAARRASQHAADVLVAGPVDAGRCTAADVSADAATLGPVADAVLCLVNVARREAGSAALRSNDRLSAAARGHAEDMVARRFFSHETPDGVSGFERASAAGYLASQFSEAIAAAAAPAATARGVVGAWLASDGHRAVLLDPSYRDAGTAVAAGTPEGAPGGTFVLDLGDR